ncbi:hypothetical protein [Nocardioides sp. 616]|uniref:hypothetical protein n=1 Tax=Nocardioides sp. 616 TaxID=2268090 RepID=UPI000CE3D722|nr:hypothetical protein [Nocardioides sp. 616]
MEQLSARARRLVALGYVVLLGPLVVLVAVLVWLAFHYLRVVTPLVGLLAFRWAVAVVSAWFGTRPRPAHPSLAMARDPGLDTFELLGGMVLDGAVPVSRTEQPRLWGLVDEVAEACATPRPQVLMVVGDATVEARDLGREVRIGVPLLVELDRRELACLLSEALAPAAAGWTDATTSLRRLVAVGERMASGTLTGWAARPTAERAARLLEEGQRAVPVPDGPTNDRLLLTRAVTEWWVTELVLDEALAHRAPRPLFDGLVALLADPVRRQALTEPGDDRAERQGSLALLDTPGELFDRVAADASIQPPQRYPWAECLDSWAARTADSCALILMRGTEPAAPTLDVLLDLVGAGDLPARLRALTRDPDADVQGLATFALAGTLVSALTSADAGRPSGAWDGGIDLVDTAGVPMGTREVAAQVLGDPSLVGHLRALLDELGVPRRWEVSPAVGGMHVNRLRYLEQTGVRTLPGTGFPHGQPRS